MLVLAEKLGWRIFELPVHWTDDPDTRVRLLHTAWNDVKGLWRLRRNLARGRYPYAIQPDGVPSVSAPVPKSLLH